MRGATAEDLEDLRRGGLRLHVVDVGTGGTYVLPDPADGTIYAVCAPPLAMMGYGTTRRISRVTGVRRGATEREVISVYNTTPAG